MSTGSNIAVVGGGISGLGAAWHLAPGHDVHLFERAPRLGGHTHTHAVRTPDGPVSVDTGFIVYNETTYPLLTRLFDELGVGSRPTNMSFSCRCDACDVVYSGLGVSGVFARRRNALDPRFLRFLVSVQRFHALGRSVSGARAGQALEDLVAMAGGNGDLGRHYVFPLASALWSTGIDEVRRFPASTFLDFFRSHRLFGIRGRLEWRSVAGGSSTYIAAIMRRLEGRAHTGVSVRAIERGPGGPRLHFGDGSSQGFDRVIVATHADEALRLLITPTDREREALGAWTYAESDTWLHSDAGVLADEPAAHASWNYHLADCRHPAARPTMTYNLNRLQGLGTDTPFLVTLNPAREPDAVHARMTYRHPIYTAGSVAAQDELRALNRVGGGDILFCGAYLGYGFHEDGLRAGLEAATLASERPTRATRPKRPGRGVRTVSA